VFLLLLVVVPATFALNLIKQYRQTGNTSDTKRKQWQR
jgi:hypothetical protein